MEEQKKVRRRTRNETNSERTHTCGCGKTYLSYPALYLHQKIKHNGQQPMGTVTNKKVQQTTIETLKLYKPENNKTDDASIISIASLFPQSEASLFN
jgi:hypothetical protein